eukprot:scaffold221630_cov30-Tisochrysis_lutea.AAC.1
MESLLAAESMITKHSRIFSSEARRTHSDGSPQDGDRRPSDTMIQSCSCSMALLRCCSRARRRVCTTVRSKPSMSVSRWAKRRRAAQRGGVAAPAPRSWQRPAAPPPTARVRRR